MEGIILTGSTIVAVLSLALWGKARLDLWIVETRMKTCSDILKRSHEVHSSFNDLLNCLDIFEAWARENEPQALVAFRVAIEPWTEENKKRKERGEFPKVVRHDS